LANPDSALLGVLGAGVQARAHIEAFARVCRLQRIKIFSPSAVSAAAIKRDMENAVSAPIEITESTEAVVRDCDLLVTATTAKEPIVSSEWLKPGVHINAIGSHRPDLREIDGATLARAKVVVDSRDAIMAECGDILLALKENSVSSDVIHGEIGEILAGTKPGRSSPSEITLYKSVGIAIQDVAVANLVYHKARERFVGTNVEI
jgi:ornithine cyclodeaminase/alanine dehydrogenase-like protein (mu-crystallin family)